MHFDVSYVEAGTLLASVSPVQNLRFSHLVPAQDYIGCHLLTKFSSHLSAACQVQNKPLKPLLPNSGTSVRCQALQSVSPDWRHRQQLQHTQHYPCRLSAHQDQEATNAIFCLTFPRELQVSQAEKLRYSLMAISIYFSALLLAQRIPQFQKFPLAEVM